MYYSINVAKNGMHFFATAEHSVTSEGDLKEVLPVMVAKFPKSEGYEVSVTCWSSTGHTVDIQPILDEVTDRKKPQHRNGNNILTDGSRCDIMVLKGAIAFQDDTRGLI
jgi:hypothetical protein